MVEEEVEATDGEGGEDVVAPRSLYPNEEGGNDPVVEGRVNLRAENRDFFFDSRLSRFPFTSIKRAGIESLRCLERSHSSLALDMFLAAPATLAEEISPAIGPPITGNSLPPVANPSLLAAGRSDEVQSIGPTKDLEVFKQGLR